MTEEEFKKINKNAKIITPETFFHEIQMGKENFNDLIFVGETPEKTVDSERSVLFNNCLFVDGFILKNTTCKDSVFVTKCLFQTNVTFGIRAKFKNLTFTECTAMGFTIDNGAFENVNIHKAEFEFYSILGGKFNSFNITQTISIIKRITFYNTDSDFGKISVTGVKVDSLIIQGKVVNQIHISNVEFRHLSLQSVQVEEKISFSDCASLDKMSKISIHNSNLSKSEFYNIDFSRFLHIEINSSIITECQFIGCIWGDNFFYLKGYQSIISQKEVYRQLKLSMSSHKDNVQEQFFYGKEMDMLYILTKWKWKSLGNKLILFFSKYTSNFGQSLFQPLVILLVGHAILFFSALLLGAFHPLHVSLVNPDAKGLEIGFEKFFVFISPFRKWENSMGGYLIIIDVFMRILSAFMIYNMVRVTRRFIDK